MARRNSSDDPQADDETPGAPFWMTTFSDMVTLLVTFFVMLVSVSEVKKERFQKALSQFPGRPSILMQESVMKMNTPPQPTQEHKSRRRDGNYDRLLEYLHEKGLQDKVQVDMRQDGLHLAITDSVMFRVGQTSLLPRAKELLGIMSSVITARVFSVVVEGHTDNRPIRTARFASNWELSTGRASSVARFLMAQDTPLPPSQYAVAGYGPYRPRATNATASGRARNRRVEIFLRWDKAPVRQESTTPFGLTPGLS